MYVLCVELFFLSAQEVSPPKAVFGIRYTANYVYLKGDDVPQDYFHVLNSQPAVFVEFNQHHEVHVGVVLAHLFNPSWINRVYYQDNARGLFIGYRYFFNETTSKGLRIFGQIDGSCTVVKYTTFGLGSGVSRLITSNLWGGGISFGADYKLTKHISLSAGVGAGFTSGISYQPFETILVSPFLGIDYRF